MAIQTNISLTATEKEYFQRFVNLAVNETPLPQGDGTIRISPFDDYFLFTLFDEVDGEDTPIDLSNVGNVYINFIGSSDEIAVKNHTQVQEVDMSRGEVLFRITKSDSKKILALDNNNFYISTKMIDEGDGSISDESVLYQGMWLAYKDANRITLTSQMEDERLEYSRILARIEGLLVSANTRGNKYKQLYEEGIVTIQALNTSNEELTNLNTELAGDLKSSQVEEIARRAKAAQNLAQAQLIIRQQKQALRHSGTQNKARKKSFFRQAAKNLQQYSVGKNSVSMPSDANGGNFDNFNNKMI
jgi:hypothetical protein